MKISTCGNEKDYVSGYIQAKLAVFNIYGRSNSLALRVYRLCCIDSMYLVLTTHVINLQGERVHSSDFFSFNSLYKLLLHPGDIYISCIINRNNRSECFYEGVGTVGEILSIDGELFYAKLEKYHCFEKKVPLTLPDGKFVEHLGRENTSLDPFTSNRLVRLLKSDAYNYILQEGGKQLQACRVSRRDCSTLELMLKQAVRSYFVEQQRRSIFQVERISRQLGWAISVFPEPDSILAVNPYEASLAYPHADASAISLEQSLKTVQRQLDEQRQHTEELKAELQKSEEHRLTEVGFLTESLKQVEARYQSLLMQQKQELMQLENADVVKCRLENSLLLAETQIVSLKEQLVAMEMQRTELQENLEKSAAFIKGHKQEYTDLLSQYDADRLKQERLENELNELKTAHKQLECERTAENNRTKEEIAVLNEQLAIEKNQNKASKEALELSEERIQNFGQKYVILLQKYKKELLLRTQIESELISLKEEQGRKENVRAAADEQQNIEIRKLKRQYRALEQKRERLELDLRASERRNQGICQYCGGSFSGFLRKKCSVCGCDKDY